MPPLTPKFNLSQTETEVLVTVYVPAASSLASFCHHGFDDGGEARTAAEGQGVEIYLSDDNDVDDDGDQGQDQDEIDVGSDDGKGRPRQLTKASTLHFFASPCYLLKLNFSPYKFQIPTTDDPTSGGDGIPPASYNPADHTICIHLKKAPLPLAVRATTVSSTDDENNNNNNLLWPDFDNTLSSKWVVQSALQNDLGKHQREIPQQWLHSVIDNNNNNSDDDIEEGDDRENDEERNTNTDSKHSTTETNLKSPAAAAASAGTATSSTTTLPSLVAGAKTSRITTRPMYGYGFGDMFQRILTDYCRAGLAQEMLELGKVADDVECVSPIERYDLRLEKEQDDFDPDRYLGDYDLDHDDNEDDYMYSLVVSYVPWWKTKTTENDKRSVVENDGNDDDSVDIVTNQLQTNLTITPKEKEHNESSTTTTTTTTTNSMSTSTTLGNIGLFTNDEHILLTSIPYPLLPQHVVSCPPDSRSNQSLWCGLLDILLSYMYDHITTMGDPTVESAWTVSILSPRLSWLDNSNGDDNTENDNDDNTPQSFHRMIQFTVQSFIRRMLIYPYWRNFNFGFKHVVRNLSELLERHGFLGIIKCLLQTRSIMTKSECYYLNNKIWIDPYLCWIQGQYRIQEQQQLDSTTSLLGHLIGSLKDILLVEGTHDESSSSKYSSLKDSLDLDLRRYERMLLTDENDDERDDADSEDDEEEVSSDESDSSDEDSDDDDSDDDSRHDDVSNHQVHIDGSNDSAVEKPNTEDDEEGDSTNQNRRLCLDDIVGGNEQPQDHGHNNVIETKKRRPLIEELS